MARLNWEPSGRYETGLDRGVFYPKNVTYPIVATNLATDPIPTTGSNWFASNPGGANVSTGYDSDEQAWYVLVNSVGTSNAFTTRYGNNAATWIPVEEGHTYRVEFKAMSTVDDYRATSIDWFKADHTSAGTMAMNNGARIEMPSGEYVDFLCIGTAPAEAAYASVGILYSGAAGGGPTSTILPAGAKRFCKQLIVTEDGTTEDYFDGSSSDTGLYTYEWTGAPGASTSVKRQIVGSAIPWNGLTSVDENGADSAVSYYIDGRPFLFFPKPKEFQATIKAYTYPDEFAAVMGLVEATDGMYLDSQVGDAFDLSYRTLLGDSIQGTDAGYKIHLVYNATVAPQGLTYESASNSINPTDLSWEIQAVPVRIDGYRPTAHVVIDTRHMDATRIAEIEALLYGDDTHAPAMPTPQTVFDLLSFGDAIIITDNGDGTWQAEGSYKNIYLIGDGVFQIDNVDAVDNGDGTFRISTTNA